MAENLQREWSPVPESSKNTNWKDPNEGWTYLKNPIPASEYVYPQPQAPVTPEGNLLESAKRAAEDVAGAAGGVAEFIAGGVGALANMDIQTFATLGLVNKEKAAKMQDAISKALDPETEVGKLLTQVGSTLFSLIPEGGETLAKRLGASDDTATDVKHLLEAGELALGLKKAFGPKAGEGTPKPTPETGPSGPTQGTPPAPPSARGGELMPKDEAASDNPIGMARQPIEGEVIRPQLPPPTSDMPGAAGKDLIPGQPESPGPKPLPSPGGSHPESPTNAPRAMGELLRAREIDGAVAQDIPLGAPGRPELTFAEQRAAAERTAQETSVKVSQFVPVSQRGAIDPTIFTDVWDKVRGAIWNKALKPMNESGIMAEVRRGTSPLENMSPEVAAAMKQTANEGRAINYSLADFIRQANEFSPEAQRRMALARENPQVAETMTPAEKEFTGRFWQYHSTVADVAQQLGIIKSNKPDWFPHLVKEIYASRKGVGGGLKTSVGSAARRKWEGTITEVEQASGLERIVNIKAAIAVTHDLAHAVRGRQIIDYVRDLVNQDNETHVGLPGQGIARGEPIDIPGATSRKYYTERSVTVGGERYPIKNGYTTINGTNYLVDMEAGQVTVGGEVYKVQKKNVVEVTPIYATPDIKAALEAIGKADEPGILYKAIQALKIAQIQIKMLNPLFHLGTVFPKAVLTLPKFGLSRDVWLHPENVWGKETYEAMSPVQQAFARTPFGIVIAGDILRQDRETVMQAIRDGVNIPGERGWHMDVYGTERPPELEQSWMRRVLNNMVPGMNLGDKASAVNRFWHYDLLWKQVGNMGLGVWQAMKTSRTNALVDKFTTEKGRAPTAQEYQVISDAAGKVAGTVASMATGMLGKEDFGSTYRKALDMLQFSRQNTMTNLRLLKMGIGVMPTYLQGQLKGVADAMGANTAIKLGLGFAAAMLVKDLFLTQGLGNVVNYVTTNHYNIPDKNGNIGGHFMSNNEGGKEDYIAMYPDNNGRVIYLNSPFRSARDLTRLTIGSIPEKLKFIEDKLSPNFSLAKGIYTGKDWQGHALVDPTGTLGENMMQALSWATKEMTGYEQLYGSISPDANHSYRVLQNFGLQPSLGRVGGAPMSELQRRSADEKAHQEYLMNTANSLLAQGKVEEGADFIREHGLYSHLKSYYLRANNPNLAALLRLRYKEMLKSANPEDKEQILKQIDASKYGE